GEFVALLGHNGSGKSTLAKLLASVLDMQSGSIVIDGISLGDIKTEEELFELRSKVGMVFQNPDDQLVATVVEEDIAFGPENLGLDPIEIRRRVYRALQAVDMLAYRKHAPHRLSGGQKQRIAIAGVLAMMPECIVFDEATAMLDPKGRRDVMRMIEKIHESGITVLHITHNMKEALLADRVVVINDGKLLLEGTPREVFSQVETLREVGLEAPQVTELFYALRQYGIDVSEDTVTEDEAFDAICKLYEDSV
ncbi:MAG: energy-coupling factor transporter ATPase, partial [Clostridia bacterium]|nr:energy-coupling factor transporter ATPase [Clostridia bacterium]